MLKNLLLFATTIKNPPAIEIFFKKATNCIWLLKSTWNINVTVTVNITITEAQNRVLKPIMIKIGNIISKIVEGKNKNSGMPYSSI